MCLSFIPVEIPWEEWINRLPEHEGERVLWSDGSARGCPETDARTVTVLRRVVPIAGDLPDA